LVEEIRALKAAGLLQNPKQLQISDSCTLILPYHRKLDQAREAAAGHEKIGTTGKGIGPAYEDRASRKAILFGDLFALDSLKAKLSMSLQEKNFLLEKFYKAEPYNVDDVLRFLNPLIEELAPYRCRDTSLVIYRALKAGKKVLFEGAQGSLLDLLHGTYPFVTSSSTIAGAATIGSGIGPTQLQKVVAIAKGYTTRVGSGPFPTECEDEIGEQMRVAGHEFGSTTGRPRRCGWLDLLALQYAIRINGITNIALMKIDVLSGFKELKVCTAYELDGQVIHEYPVSPGELARCKPVYETLPGWDVRLEMAKSMKDLPRNAQNYVHFVGTQLGVPIDVVSVGPGRDQTLWIKPLF
jgi:adenylosuccinate synthase